MNIALLGYGVVGKNVEKLCSEKGIEIIYILRRNSNQLDKENMTIDINDILNDKRVEAVVECMGGDMPAYEYVRQSLEKGKHVVTSNKKMLANHYLELMKIAEKNKRKLLFSSACGGGIPWIQELLCISKSDTISSFTAIMNGTSNYILDSMFNNNLNFVEALKQAQDLGFAESDPSDDIDGIDTANKTILSAGIIFGYQFNISNMYVKGIRYINDDIFDYCNNNDLSCVLLGKGYRNNDDSFCLYVMPSLINKKSNFANIHGSYNCFHIETNHLESLNIVGQGAGGIPTASNIIRDLLSIDETENVKLIDIKKINYKANKKNYYIYSKEKIDEQYIEKIIKENNYLTKKIDIDTLTKIVKDDKAFIGEVEND